MAHLTLYRDKLKHNYKRLTKLLDKNSITLSLVTKLLCGNKTFLQEVLSLGAQQICDSRISNLKMIKRINPSVETLYIKPPAKNIIPSIVSFADISLNTQYDTISLLSKEAQRQKKIHKIIIMIEMGDLREGVLGKNLIDFYKKVFKLKGISVIGLGVNLNCLHGVMPSRDKLIQLALYKQIIELKFERNIPFLSGGTTVTLPLIKRKEMPVEINHFRVGEALFFGADLFTDGTLPGFYPSVFELCAYIIEIEKKPKVPTGEFKRNPSGEMYEVNQKEYGELSYRAIIDIGLLDVNPNYLTPVSPDVQVIGASSDMLVVELGDRGSQYRVGNILKFQVKYMGALSLMNSDYIEKIVI